VATRSDEARGFWRSLGAEDFLAEAWIELPEALPPAAPRPRAEEGASAFGGQVLRGERLPGDPGVV
jgi:hypothetical protein